MQLAADSLVIATTLCSFIKVVVEAVAVVGDSQAHRKDHCRRGSVRRDQHKAALGLPVVEQQVAVLAVTVARLLHFDCYLGYPRMRSRNHSFPG